MKRFFFLVLIIFINSFTLFYAQVGINTSTPHPKSILELFSNSKGFLPPRLTSEERDALLPSETPNEEAEGMVIYNKTVHCLEFWNSAEWINTCQDDSSLYVINCEPVVNGNFYVGSPASGSVRIKVTVSRIGAYSINTGVINGMSFSGEGNFENTGEQYVILSAPRDTNTDRNIHLFYPQSRRE